jgi:poly(A) polymerase
MSPTNNDRQINAAELGIDLSSRNDEDLFKWLLACLLFGKPIQQQVAKRTYEVLTGAGVASLDKLAGSTWDELVKLLDQGHYVRYDYSTATKLLEVSRAIKEQYGSVLDLISTAASAHELEKRLIAFRCIGPTTTEIFLRDVGPIWFGGGNSHDLDSAKHAADILKRHGFEAYIIGGAVRDIQLGKRPKDFDLATNATPDQIAQISDFVSKYKEPAQAYGVTRVKFLYDGAPEGLEIATFRKDVDSHLGRKATRVEYATLKDDVLRRDFTINALALEPTTGKVVDLVGGRADLKAKIIRFIGDPAERIAEDPLRIMRAIRFKNHLGFDYDEATRRAIAWAVQNGAAESIATDRLRDELTLLLMHHSRRLAAEDLDEFGIMQRILPEVAAGKNTVQPPQYHSEGSVWQHQLLTLEYLPEHPSRRLAWAALLHDIGKAPTADSPDGSDAHLRFNRHYTVGANMAREILKRLNFSSRDINDISWMIHYHMTIDDLPDMRLGHQRQMLGHPAFEDLLELHRADAAASWRPGKPHGQKPRFVEIERLWHEYQSTAPELRLPSLKRDLGIDGHWLKEKFGSQFELSGRTVGKVLSELNEIYQDEGLTDPEYYAAEARRLLKLYQQSS